MLIFNKILNIINKPKNRIETIKENCGCVCYCKDCREPLNDKSEVKVIDDDGVYEYTCNECGNKSLFHFGIAPVPILISYQRRNDEYQM